MLEINDGSHTWGNLRMPISTHQVRRNGDAKAVQIAQQTDRQTTPPPTVLRHDGARTHLAPDLSLYPNSGLISHPSQNKASVSQQSRAHALTLRKKMRATARVDQTSDCSDIGSTSSLDRRSTAVAAIAMRCKLECES